jgi:hypothetical protein
VNGLYVLDLEDKPVYNSNAKRLRPNNLNPTFIWHCRLGHINEKRIEKIHKDGLLSSFDFESFDTCESCLLGKMTKRPSLVKVRGQLTCSDLYIPMYVDQRVQ